jgi:hypothetical protein
MSILWRVLTMVYNAWDYWALCRCPSSGILKDTFFGICCLKYWAMDKDQKLSNPKSASWVLMSITEELLGRNSSGSGQENREYDWGIRCADHATPSICKSWYYFAKKPRSLGRHSSLADQSHGDFFFLEWFCSYWHPPGDHGLSVVWNWRAVA